MYDSDINNVREKRWISYHYVVVPLIVFGFQFSFTNIMPTTTKVTVMLCTTRFSIIFYE
ncbi:hypothetical protein SASPL_147434 [Salvia splendens]|uniref:Uncharacterized protein n=1 Tax=Salvia splendens TaxID=180675 RepID=A0A8X8WF80_SALSN|nr:hypothetical protein SASPL_147434 [Salvia splendens]